MKTLLRGAACSLATLGLIGLASPSLACEGKKHKEQSTTSMTPAKKDDAALKEAPKEKQTENKDGKPST